MCERLVEALEQVLGDRADLGAVVERHHHEAQEDHRRDRADPVVVDRRDAVLGAVGADAQDLRRAEVGRDEGQAGDPRRQRAAGQEVVEARLDVALGDAADAEDRRRSTRRGSSSRSALTSRRTSTAATSWTCGRTMPRAARCNRPRPRGVRLRRSAPLGGEQLHRVGARGVLAERAHDRARPARAARRAAAAATPYSGGTTTAAARQAKVRSAAVKRSPQRWRRPSDRRSATASKAAQHARLVVVERRREVELARAPSARQRIQAAHARGPPTPGRPRCCSASISSLARRACARRSAAARRGRGPRRASGETPSTSSALGPREQALLGRRGPSA